MSEPKFKLGKRVEARRVGFGGAPIYRSGPITDIYLHLRGRTQYVVDCEYFSEDELVELPDTILVELNVADVDRFLDDWRNNRRYIFPDSTTKYLFNVYGAFERAFDARSQ